MLAKATFLLLLQRAAAGVGGVDDQLLWSDEFDSDSLDKTYWSYDLGGGGWGNFELQTYTHQEENVDIDGGMLKLTARRIGDSTEFTSGRINTDGKLRFQYGTVEASIKIPNLNEGLWPSLKTLGEDFETVGWPASGEYDIMQLGSGQAIEEGVANRQVYSGAHWLEGEDYAFNSQWLDYAEDLDDGLHTYRMDWTPSQVTTYVDGERVWEMDLSDCDSCEELHQPHYFVLSLAVGGLFTSTGAPRTDVTAPLPATMFVDWIRIYDNGYTVVYGPGTGSPESPTASPTECIEDDDVLDDYVGSDDDAGAADDYASVDDYTTGADDYASSDPYEDDADSTDNIFKHGKKSGKGKGKGSSKGCKQSKSSKSSKSSKKGSGNSKTSSIRLRDGISSEGEAKKTFGAAIGMIILLLGIGFLGGKYLAYTSDKMAAKKQAQIDEISKPVETDTVVESDKETDKDSSSEDEHPYEIDIPFGMAVSEGNDGGDGDGDDDDLSENSAYHESDGDRDNKNSRCMVAMKGGDGDRLLHVGDGKDSEESDEEAISLRGVGADEEDETSVRSCENITISVCGDEAGEDETVGSCENVDIDENAQGVSSMVGVVDNPLSIKDGTDSENEGDTNVEVEAESYTTDSLDSFIKTTSVGGLENIDNAKENAGKDPGAEDSNNIPWKKDPPGKNEKMDPFGKVDPVDDIEDTDKQSDADESPQEHDMPSGVLAIASSDDASDVLAFEDSDEGKNKTMYSFGKVEPVQVIEDNDKHSGTDESPREHDMPTGSMAAGAGIDNESEDDDDALRIHNGEGSKDIGDGTCGDGAETGKTMGPLENATTEENEQGVAGMVLPVDDSLSTAVENHEDWPEDEKAPKKDPPGDAVRVEQQRVESHFEIQKTANDRKRDELKDRKRHLEERIQERKRERLRQMEEKKKQIEEKKRQLEEMKRQLHSKPDVETRKENGDDK